MREVSTIDLSKAEEDGSLVLVLMCSGFRRVSSLLFPSLLDDEDSNLPNVTVAATDR